MEFKENIVKTRWEKFLQFVLIGFRFNLFFQKMIDIEILY